MLDCAARMNKTPLSLAIGGLLAIAAGIGVGRFVYTPILSYVSARMEGIEAIRKKNQWWFENHEIHSSGAKGPWPHGDRFIVLFKIDVTAKAGPMAGKRMQAEEAGLYTVKDGKIVKEEFFYDMGG